MKLSEIKTNWKFTKNIGATSYWFGQTDDGTGKTIGPEEVLEIGCQLEVENKKIADAAVSGIAKAWKRVEILEAKLAAIECSDCGLTMLVCECDDVEDG